MESYTDNASIVYLSRKHEHMLLCESVIDPGVRAERGTFTAWRGRDVPQDGGRLPARPGLVFPVHTLDSGRFHRLRLNSPGKGPRYWQPKGHANRLDVHPRQHERIKQPGGMRYITEGEKKVDAGVSQGLLMVGQSGVFNGQRDKGAALIDDWYLLPLKGEKYSICYDSDIESNPMVQLAANRQARLLQERGAEVFITLIPPGPNGEKQGLDDFFANGGTVKEVEMLTRPYESLDIGEARLARDERLRKMVASLRRDWYEADWMGFVGAADKPNWARGHTARDVNDALIYFAMRRGRPDERGIVFSVGTRALAERAAKSATSAAKAVTHLQAAGGLEIIPQEDKTKPRTYRLLVDSATLYSMEKGTSERESNSRVTRVGHRCKGLRYPTASRLRWSSPGRKGRLVRHHEATTGRTVTDVVGVEFETPYIRRLGPHRGAVVDVLEKAGGELHLTSLCEALHRKRPWDVRRRLIKPLEEAGVIECEGDVIRLSADWLDKLEEERERKGEIEQAERQAKKHREESTRYREHLEREKRGTPEASHEAVLRMEVLRRRRLREIREEERDRAPTPPAVETLVARILGQQDRIRMGLLCEIARDEGLRWRDVPPAVRRMGYRVERLPEYGDEEFIYTEKQAAS
jgi:Domain of unknown function (DUF3854)